MKNVTPENLGSFANINDYKKAIAKDSAHLKKAHGITIVKDYVFPNKLKETVVLFTKKSNDAKEAFKGLKDKGYAAAKMAYGQCDIAKDADGKPQLRIKILDGGLSAEAIEKEGKVAFNQLGVKPKMGDFQINEEEPETDEPATADTPADTTTPQNNQQIADELAAKAREISALFAEIKNAPSPALIANAVALLHTWIQKHDAAAEAVKNLFKTYIETFRTQFTRLSAANAPQKSSAPTTSGISAPVGKGGTNKPEDVRTIQTLLRQHGYQLVVDGDCGNKTIQAISNFQTTKAGLSRADGKIDPGGRTWQALVRNNAPTPPADNTNPTPTPPADNTNPAPNPSGPLVKPNWVSVAEAEIGVKEVVGRQHNPRVLEYHATTGGFSDDETPWCSSFVNWVMKKAGQAVTGSAVALSWKRYGKKLDRPAYGSIAVFSWGGGKGHVGFVVGKQGSNILVLGGNQSNAVNVAKFDPKKAVAFVVPTNYEVPANAYTFGESTGDFGGGSDISNTR